MKKFIKTAANFLAVAVMATAALGFSACEDIRTLELSLSVYDNANKVYYAEDDIKFSVDLYRHLAPKTVDAVLEHVKAGYYDDAIFYIDESNSSQIMMGDLKFEDGKLVQNLIDGKLPSEIYGEFENNGVTGSNLVSEKGSVGIWRSYYESDDSYKTSSAARDSGRATWYIPTSSISSYNGYFCVFAQFDTANDANAKAIDAISAIFANSDYYTEYVIYYTGTYDGTKADENYGLNFKAMKKTDFDALAEEPDAFEADGQQLVCFNKKTVKIPNIAGDTVSAKVNKITVK